MSTPSENILVDFSVNSPSSEEAIEAAEMHLTCQFPSDYRDFILRYDGGEGFIGKHYFSLWRIEELVEFNNNYQVSKYAPGFVLFGSTGGGDGFAFDIRTSPYRIMQIPFIGMSLEDGFFVAESFTRLLERMIETEGPLF